MTKGIKAKDIRDFEKYAKKLNEVICRIREYNNSANIYLSEDELHLMCGESHNCNGVPQWDNIVSGVIMIATDGGGW